MHAPEPGPERRALALTARHFGSLNTIRHTESTSSYVLIRVVTLTSRAFSLQLDISDSIIYYQEGDAFISYLHAY